MPFRRNLLISVDKPYRFLQLNRQGMQLLKYPEGDVEDTVLGEPIENLIHPDDYDRLVKMIETADTDGRKSTFEFRVQRAGGEYFWVSGILERTFDENENRFLLPPFADVTEEKLAEQEAERKYWQERITLVSCSNAYPVIISINLTEDTLNFIYVKPGRSDWPSRNFTADCFRTWL